MLGGNPPQKQKPQMLRVARSRRRRRITMRGTVCLALCFFILSVARAAEEGAQCSDADGSCGGGSASGDDPRPHRMLRLHSDGSIALRDQTYVPGGEDEALMGRLQEMESDARRVEELMALGGKRELRRAANVLAPELFERLTSLAAEHWEGWTAAALGPSGSPPESGEGGDANVRSGRAGGRGDERAAREFDRAVNAYEAALEVYQRAWSVVTEGGPSQATERGPHAFSRYEQEGILAGQISIDLAVADLHHQRFNVGKDDESAPGDCMAAYRHLVQAERRCRQSLEVLGEGGGGEMFQGERAVDHDVLVTEVKQMMAFAFVRLGALLVDMYSVGYDLAEDMSTFVKPNVVETYEEGAQQLGEGQQRMLELTLQKLTMGYTIYNRLSELNGAVNYRLNIADTRNYLGVVYGYLFLWSAAAHDLDGSLSTYEQILDAYRTAGMVTDTLEIASSMIQTTQSLWEAYLNLPGKEEFAKKVFRRHLALRRYSKRQTPLDEPLADEEEEEDAFYHGADGDLPNEYDLLQYEETLKTYETMLNDYLQLQSKYPPDGSYFDMSFDDLGANPSYIQHDKVYEGSLRSAIGSLQLSQNKLWEARGELELAVSLLSDGADDGYGDSFEAYDENGEILEYPVKLELANALLNLSYAQLGLKQWRSSYESFEDAMDLYASELSEGETPMNHADPAMMEAKKGNSWSEILTSYMKGSAGTKEDAKTLEEDTSEEKDLVREESRYINLDDYQMVENITGSIY